MGGPGSGRHRKVGRPKGSGKPKKRGRPRKVGRPKGIHTKWSRKKVTGRGRPRKEIGIRDRRSSTNVDRYVWNERKQRYVYK
jgi:hypothetical protein